MQCLFVICDQILTLGSVLAVMPASPFPPASVRAIFASLPSDENSSLITFFFFFNVRKICLALSSIRDFGVESTCLSRVSSVDIFVLCTCHPFPVGCGHLFGKSFSSLYFYAGEAAEVAGSMCREV